MRMRDSDPDKYREYPTLIYDLYKEHNTGKDCLCWGCCEIRMILNQAPPMTLLYDYLKYYIQGPTNKIFRKKLYTKMKSRSGKKNEEKNKDDRAS